MRKESNKNLRVNAEVQRALSKIISYGLKDPRVAPMTTVTSVNVTPDLKFCKVFISVLGDEDAKIDTMKGINSAKGYIRKELAAECKLRATPELIFELDNSIEYAINISKKIDEVMGNSSDEDDTFEEDEETSEE